MKTLRILQLSSENNWRGGEQQIAYLIEELLAKGVEVHVAVKRGSEFEKFCSKKNIPHYPMPFKNSLDIKTAIQLAKLCKTIKPDVVHMHSSKSHGIGVLSALLGNKAPLILSRRVAFLPGKSVFTKWKYNHPSIKKIICISNNVKEVMNAYITSLTKCTTIYSGIDLSKVYNAPHEPTLRSEYSISNEKFLIGNTSALEDEKDYPTFINAIGILVEKKISVQAFVIGKGSLKDELQEYIKKKNLESHILFTGFRTDVLTVLKELDLFMITSKKEGLGTSVLDAFAAGVPVVATAAGGIPEMVQHEVTGMLAPIGDSASLANSIERIINNVDFRNQLIKNAGEKVKEFSKEQTAAKTLLVYQEVAS